MLSLTPADTIAHGLPSFGLSCDADGFATERFPSPGTIAALEAVLGKSPASGRVLEVVGRIADVPVAALLEGESGTGKEFLARVIHRTSHVAEGPFVAVNCGALPGPLLEAELSGHTKGAFTGATTDLGQDTTERVTVRILAATNRELQRLAREGRFREDLYYRLAAIRIRLPPLRERSEEIVPLLEFFLEQYGRAFGRKVPTLSPGVQAALLQYPFPGNVRELENVAKHLILLARGSEAALDDLPPAILGEADPRRLARRGGVRLADGKSVLSIGDDGVTKLTDFATGADRRVGRSALESAVCSLVVAADGKSALVGQADGGVRVLSLPSGQVTRTLEQGSAAIGLALWRDGSRALVLGGDGTVRAWDVRTGKLVRTFPARGAHGGLAFVSETRALVPLGVDSIGVVRWQDGSVVWRSEGEEVDGAAVTPDGNLLPACAFESAGALKADPR